MYLPSDITSTCIPIKKNMIQWHSKYNEWYKCITHGITYSFSMENDKKCQRTENLNTQNQQQEENPTLFIM